MNEQIEYMKIAMDLAKKAYKNGDVPVGAVVVQNGVIIGRGYNQKERSAVATKHAEVIAIEQACRKLGNWHLDDCVLYVTLEPCLMCAGAILQSRLPKLVYATKSEKFGYVESLAHVLSSKNNHSVEIVGGILETEAQLLLKQFFIDKRK